MLGGPAPAARRADGAGPGSASQDIDSEPSRLGAKRPPLGRPGASAPAQRPRGRGREARGSPPGRESQDTVACESGHVSPPGA